MPPPSSTIAIWRFPILMRGVGLFFIALWIWLVFFTPGHHSPPEFTFGAIISPFLLIGLAFVGLHYRIVLHGDRRHLVTTYGWTILHRTRTRDVASWRTIQIGPAEERRNPGWRWRFIPLWAISDDGREKLAERRLKTSAATLAHRIGAALGIPIVDRESPAIPPRSNRWSAGDRVAIFVMILASFLLWLLFNHRN